MKSNQITYTRRRIFVLLLICALLIGILPVGQTPISKATETLEDADPSDYGLYNPWTTSDDITTWYCVYFGNYWQEDTNGDGVADKNDDKTPIKWRVLSVDGNDAFLLADQNLDCQKYNDTSLGVTWITWETCTIRSWLNGYGADANECGVNYSDNNFLDNAFTETEQVAIKNTTVINEDNPFYGIDGGENTVDKVYLLSLSEVINPLYGFLSDYNKKDESRRAKNTAYVRALDTSLTISDGDYLGNGNWWLRSPGRYRSCVSYVMYNGEADYFGPDIHNENTSVRPALHLDLSSTSSWSYAGTVTSDGGVIEPLDISESGRRPVSPTNCDGVTTWDCVWFGNYPQRDVAGETKTPIRWRVLSVNGDDAFLLADTNLDVQRYNDIWTGVTWETCTMRTWLNSAFLNKAFSASEQAAIKNTNVVNEDNPSYGTEGGNNTTDKVYLLSIGEVMNPTYGFNSTTDDTETREAVNTVYVAAGGEIKLSYMSSAGHTSPWLLRSPGRGGGYVSNVDINGLVSQSGYVVSTYRIAVRPVLHLDLSSTESWSYAGTATSKGGEAEIAPPSTPTPSPSSTPTPLATETPNASVTSTPTLVPTVTQSANPSATLTPVPTQIPTVTQNPNPSTTSTPNITLPLVTESPFVGQNPVIMPLAVVAQDIISDEEQEKDITLGKVTALKLKAKKKAIQASWKKVSGASGYQIWLSTSKNFKKKTVKTTKKENLMVKKLKSGKTYFVKVRAYTVNNGERVYGAWSKTVKKKVK